MEVTKKNKSLIQGPQTTSNGQNSEEEDQNTYNFGYLEDDENKEKIISEYKSYCNSAQPTTACIPECLKQLKTGTRLQKLKSGVLLRKLLILEETAPKDKIQQSGVVKDMVDLVKTSDEHLLRADLTWCLTNLAAGNEQNVRNLEKNHAIELFVAYLEDPDPELANNCVWGLSNVAITGAEFRDLVLGLGGVDGLLKIYKKFKNQKNKGYLMRNVIWAIRSICTTKPKPNESVLLKVVPILSEILQKIIKTKKIDFSEIQTGMILNVTRSLEVLRTDSELKAACKRKLVKTLVSFILAKNPKKAPNSVILSCLEVLGFFTSKSDDPCQDVVDNSGIEAFFEMLDHEYWKIRKKACWALSNISAGTFGQIQAILDRSGLYQKLMKMATEDELLVRREASWVICNFTINPSASQLSFLLQERFLTLLRNIISVAEDNAEMLENAFLALRNVFRHGIDKLGLPEGVDSPLIMEVRSVGLDKLVLKYKENENTWVKKSAGYVIRYLDHGSEAWEETKIWYRGWRRAQA